MNNPEIPEGWRLVAVGEPITVGAIIWMRLQRKWMTITSRHWDVGKRYDESYELMATKSPVHWVAACGVIDIGTDR